MASLNKACLLGNVGSDPEVRETQNGTKIASFSLATHERWTDQRSGERVERVTWHKVVIWNENLVALAGKYLSKGRQIYIEGSIQTRKYTDRDGTDRSITEIVLQGPRAELQLLGDKPTHNDDE